MAGATTSSFNYGFGSGISTSQFGSNPYSSFSGTNPSLAYSQGTMVPPSLAYAKGGIVPPSLFMNDVGQRAQNPYQSRINISYYTQGGNVFEATRNRFNQQNPDFPMDQYGGIRSFQNFIRL